MSYYGVSDDEIREARRTGSIHQTSGCKWKGTIGGVTGVFDQEGHCIVDEHYDVNGEGMRYTDMGWWPGHFSSYEYEPYESPYDESSEHDYKDGLGLLGILMVPFALLTCAPTMINIIRKAMKEVKEQQRTKETNEYKKSNEVNNIKKEVNIEPWYKKRIDNRIRLHSFKGYNFNDICIYKDGLRNGLGIMYFRTGAFREGFYEDGMIVGQSIRYYPDGSRLIGIDKKGWAIDGRFLRIYSNYRTHIEIYKNGELVDVELPKEDEVLEHSTFYNGDIYESRAIIRMFTNKKDKAFTSKIYPDGGKFISQNIDGVQSGYALINKKIIPIYSVLINNLTLVQTLQIDELDVGQRDAPWYQNKIDQRIRLHRHNGVDFYDVCIYKYGIRNGLGIAYFKNNVTRYGFYKDGLTLGQSIRLYPDGSRLIGIDQKGWSIEGRFLRIFEDNDIIKCYVEIYVDGKLERYEKPDEKEMIKISYCNSGTVYSSEKFNYSELRYNDGGITRCFLNDKGTKLAFREFPNGGFGLCQFIDGKMKGYCIFGNAKEKSYLAKLFDADEILKIIKIEEYDL